MDGQTCLVNGCMLDADRSLVLCDPCVALLFNCGSMIVLPLTVMKCKAAVPDAVAKSLARLNAFALSY